MNSKKAFKLWTVNVFNLIMRIDTGKKSQVFKSIKILTDPSHITMR
jgi:hypothetical protein